MATKINHKRGDTFSYAGIVTLPSGRPWAARCHLRPETNPDAPKAGEITITLSELSAAEIAAQSLTVPAGATAYALLAYASAVATKLWPADVVGRRYLCDVEFYDPTDLDTVTSSESFVLVVFKDPTHG